MNSNRKWYVDHKIEPDQVAAVALVPVVVFVVVVVILVMTIPIDYATQLLVIHPTSFDLPLVLQNCVLLPALLWCHYRGCLFLGLFVLLSMIFFICFVSPHLLFFVVSMLQCFWRWCSYGCCENDVDICLFCHSVVVLLVVRIFWLFWLFGYFSWLSRSLFRLCLLWLSWWFWFFCCFLFVCCWC